ncbi:acyltransferase [soil metagenome]
MAEPTDVAGRALSSAREFSSSSHGGQLGRLDWLDTLRGLAVLFVFLLHATLDVRRHLQTGTDAPIALDIFASASFGFFDFGKIGVAIFFIVSGYLIPVTLDRSGNGVVRRFLVNRFFRLYPTYWVSILVLVIGATTALPLFQLLINLTMLQRFVGVGDLNGVFWTLQIELVFYALCVVLSLRGRLGDPALLLRFIVVCAILSIALAAVRWHLALKLPVALFLALQLMFFGYLLRLRAVAETGPPRERVALAIVIGTLLLACPLAYSRDYGFQESASRYIASYVAATTIFLFALKFRWRNALLAFIGRISYSFYLLHTIVIAAVASYFSDARPVSERLSFLGFLIAAMAFTIVVSWISYRLVEMPAIEIGRALNKSTDSSGTRAATP